jgi:nitroreductase
MYKHDRDTPQRHFSSILSIPFQRQERSVIMNVLDAIKTRKSIRNFKPDPVSKNVLAEILTTACRAPSAMNSQPWEFVVLGGEVLEKIKQAHLAKLAAGEPPGSEHSVVGWQRDSIYWNRQVALAKELFRLMDIGREDKEKRAQWTARGFRYFDAPAAIVITSDKSLAEVAPLLDLGAVMQTICLAALHYGLGTCIEDQGVMYPAVLREIAGIPAEKRIVISIALGYPDPDFPANQIETAREPLENITTWLGF